MPSPLPTISPLPPAPSITSPATFEDDAEAFAGALPGMVEEINAVTAAIPGAAQAVAAEAAEQVAQIFDISNYYSRAQVDALLAEAQAQIAAQSFFLASTR